MSCKGRERITWPFCARKGKSPFSTEETELTPVRFALSVSFATSCRVKFVNTTAAPFSELSRCASTPGWDSSSGFCTPASRQGKLINALPPAG